MPHSLTPYTFGRNLNTASIADNPFVAYALIFAAVTLPVLGRTKYLFAHQAVTLRLEGTVIYSFRLQYLSP